MIETLNAHFVPVYASMEDYADGGTAPADEKAAYRKIYRAALEAKLSTGTVHVYVVTPEGRPIDSIHVAHANTKKVLETLRRAVADLKVAAGKPVVEPRRQAVPPPGAPADALVLHLTARSLDGRGCWGELPGEDFIVLEAAEWAPLAKPGEVPREVAMKFYHRFYPSTENNDPAKDEVEEAVLTAASEGEGVLRLTGRLRMKHPFYHKKDDCRVALEAVGYVRVDGAGRVTSLQMATTEATYNGGKFGVAVRTVSAPATR